MGIGPVRGVTVRRISDMTWSAASLSTQWMGGGSSAPLTLIMQPPPLTMATSRGFCPSPTVLSVPPVGPQLLETQQLLSAPQQTPSDLSLITAETSAALASRTTQDDSLGVHHPSLLSPFSRPAFLPPQIQENARPSPLKNAGPAKRGDSEPEGKSLQQLFVS